MRDQATSEPIRDRDIACGNKASVSPPASAMTRNQVPAGTEMPTYVVRRNRKGSLGARPYSTAKTGALTRAEISPAKNRVSLCAAVSTETEDGHTRDDVFLAGTTSVARHRPLVP